MSDAENMVENENIDPRVYEVGYLLVPTISPEDVGVFYGNLKELIANLGGEILADEMPKMITLAYQMQKVIANVRNKFNTAYFGWTKFIMNPEQVLETKRKLDLDSNFLRFLISKTVKENTIAAKRFIYRDMSHRRPSLRKEGENEIIIPINKEEIDKEIEAMVAV